jgi:phosphatidylserine/phosphatidylglycerophosphate/cardiolipin synthase-like enzyme
MKIRMVFFIVVLLAASYPDLRSQSIRVYFGPDKNDSIEHVVLRELKQARDSVLIEAYGFTSWEIAELLDSLKDSVSIAILLDKSNRYSSSSMLKWLQSKKVNIWIDENVHIAHNKVIIIDGRTVLTGSYNWTESAKKNAENLLVINDSAVVAAYSQNWHKRQSKSRQKFNGKSKLPGAAPTKRYWSKSAHP